MENNHRAFLFIKKMKELLDFLLSLLDDGYGSSIESNNSDPDGGKLAVILWSYALSDYIGIEIVGFRKDASSSSIKTILPKRQSMHCCLKTSVVLAFIYLFNEIIAPPKNVFTELFSFLVM